MVNVDTQPDEQRLIARQLNDLTAVLALPAMWKGRDPAFIAASMLDILGTLLRLDVAHAELIPPPEGISKRGHRPTSCCRACGA